MDHSFHRDPSECLKEQLHFSCEAFSYYPVLTKLKCIYSNFCCRWSGDQWVHTPKTLREWSTQMEKILGKVTKMVTFP